MSRFEKGRGMRVSAAFLDGGRKGEGFGRGVGGFRGRRKRRGGLWARRRVYKRGRRWEIWSAGNREVRRFGGNIGYCSYAWRMVL